MGATSITDIPGVARRDDRAGAEVRVPLPWDADAVASLRAAEYGRLDALDQAYLDYTGAGLYAASQLRAHQQLLADSVLGNPHSDSPSSRTSTDLADRARAAILAFCGASPDEYDVVFAANASAALKLVAESFPFTDRSRLLLTADNHNSANGIREFAWARGAAVTYLPLTLPELRHDEQAVLAALDDAPAGASHLFAYPAQSNYSGVQHPPGWIEAAQARGWTVLLDASAFIATNRLDLGRRHPDFVTVSWYKAIGYPTGVGSLIARRDALARLHRPWFAGGAIGVASVAEPRHTLAPDHVGFEDGTIDFLSLPAVEIGIRHLEAIGLDTIHDRVRHLTRRMLAGLAASQHANGTPRVRLYGPPDDQDRGGTVPFNLLRPDGSVVPFPAVEAFAAARGISVRTGCFCNPGASETARGITADDMRAVFALGHQPRPDELQGILGPKALGAVRASVGIASDERDVDRLVAAVAEFPTPA